MEINQNNYSTVIDKDEPVMTIGVLADMLEVHQRTLRIYDDKKILCAKRTFRNRRIYSANDYERGKLILFLTRNSALNLSGVKIIISLLKKMKIEPKDYTKYIKEAAHDMDINERIQKENIMKTSKRGRKKNIEQIEEVFNN